MRSRLRGEKPEQVEYLQGRGRHTPLHVVPPGASQVGDHDVDMQGRVTSSAHAVAEGHAHEPGAAFDFSAALPRWTRQASPFKVG